MKDLPYIPRVEIFRIKDATFRKGAQRKKNEKFCSTRNQGVCDKRKPVSKPIWSDQTPASIMKTLLATCLSLLVFALISLAQSPPPNQLLLQQERIRLPERRQIRPQRRRRLLQTCRQGKLQRNNQQRQDSPQRGNLRAGRGNLQRLDNQELQDNRRHPARRLPLTRTSRRQSPARGGRSECRTTSCFARCRSGLLRQ